MKLVIFDVDGTLVDSQAHILGAMGRAFAGEGLACPSRDAILSIVGLSLPQAMARLLSGGEAAQLDRLVDGYRNSFAGLRSELEDASPLYPYTLETLTALRARDDVLLGIATGKSRRGVRHLLDSHDLHGAFVTIQTADTHPSKPNPSMLQEAILDAGVALCDAVMIGDTTFDMDMARNAGMTAIGVDWGYHPASDLVASGAQTVLHDYRELIPHLQTTGLLT